MRQPASKQKYRCTQCYRVVRGDALLKAPNPFSTGKIVGCPVCKGVECLVRLCDVDGCYGYGASYPSAGRFLCHKHASNLNVLCANLTHAA